MGGRPDGGECQRLRFDERSTVNDGRVRDNHAELNGQRFRFDDPPMGGGTSEDEPGNPGDGILCRCYADPVLDALIEG